MAPGVVSAGAEASQYATTNVPTASPGETVDQVRGAMLGTAYESAAELVVLDHSRLVGILPIETVLEADPDASIGSLMAGEPPVIPLNASAERAASLMAESGRGTLAVVDEHGRFAGLIPPTPMLGVLLAEHEQDLARIGGLQTGSGQARLAAEESIFHRLRHRLSWLLIGAAGAMLSALLIGLFEEELDRKVVLAFFVPAVVYLAAAVGTQTQTILIRGLSVGVRLSQVAGRELLTGTIAGAVIALVFAPFALIFFGDAAVALALGLALLVSCAAATAIAIALPWIFQRLGKDPAFGSGPLAMLVLQDLLSIAIYLAIAIPLAG